MDFDLNDLAATLAIGAFYVVGLGFVFLILSERSITSIVATVSNTSRGVVAFIAAVCFVFGMVVEDVSNRFVDDDSWLSGSAYFGSDDEIKANVFLWDYYNKSSRIPPALTNR